ncbi:MAG: hypothetical protein DWI48_05660 [Chloroflexi bacterium]|nr:MAG: hypothetical protein DWI48_05660 [Chloroflexota bacterium]
MTSHPSNRFTRGRRAIPPSLAPEDAARALEFAGGASWDDLLQYFESNPLEDLPATSKRELQRVTARVRELARADIEYPADGDALCELLQRHAA